MDITSLNDVDKLTKDSAFQLDIDGEDFQGLINLYQDSICFELSLNQNQQKLFEKIFNVLGHLDKLNYLQTIPSRQSCLTEYINDRGLSNEVEKLTK